MGHTCHWTTAQVLAMASQELARATKKHGAMASAHEGYAVIKEELDELWEQIKKQQRDEESIRKEAVQVAAMALRFVIDVCRGAR
jgi:NTP pyrophosphatase (non-canonical NTP hydrolase)